MITSYQLRAARALLDIDQRETAELADLSVPTISEDGSQRRRHPRQCGLADELVSALEAAGIELIGPGGTSTSGGRGVRLREDVASPRVLRPRQPKAVAKSVSKAGAPRAAAARDR